MKVTIYVSGTMLFIVLDILKHHHCELERKIEIDRDKETQSNGVNKATSSATGKKENKEWRLSMREYETDKGENGLVGPFLLPDTDALYTGERHQSP